MIIFLKWGVFNLDKQIMENTPSKSKLQQLIKEKDKIIEKKSLIKFSKNVKIIHLEILDQKVLN